MRSSQVLEVRALLSLGNILKLLSIDKLFLEKHFKRLIFVTYYQYSTIIYEIEQFFRIIKPNTWKYYICFCILILNKIVVATA